MGTTSNATESALKEMGKVILMKDAFDEMLTAATGLMTLQYLIAKHYEDVHAPSKEEMVTLIKERLDEIAASFNEDLEKGDPGLLRGIQELEDELFGNPPQIRIVPVGI